MSEERNWKRIRERLPLHLPVRVRGRETPTFEWNEITRLINVTPFGAGFTLKHPTEKGRLLHMTIPMPRQLRVFDHVEDQYRIWAVVRYMKPAVANNKTIFNVGVAFIGKRPPASYETEPWKRYDISTSAFQALSKPDEILIPLTDQRVYTRHNIAVDMRLEIVNVEGEVSETEHSVTENISARGATIFTTLQIPLGRFIRLTSEQYGLTVHAAIRSRSTGADGVPRIHVEFIDREWPL
ncbi:MAG TPA: hypothetical protein VHS05_23090 [Pyrinomonadaceae bacterium]|jgi:hypothetical protein|nr:hypothetical protein [Pyrinomonadaceae bacterium]